MAESLHDRFVVDYPVEVLERPEVSRHQAKPPHEQWMHAGKKKAVAKTVEKLLVALGAAPAPAKKARPRKAPATTGRTGRDALAAAPIELGDDDFARAGGSLDAEPFVFYRDSGYEDINAYLRALALGEDPENLDPDGEFGAITSNMDDAFNQSRLTEPVVVYRGVAELDAMLGGFDTDRSLVGLEYVEDAYTSTSADKRVSGAFGTEGVLIKVNVPAGVGGLQLSKFYDGEISDQGSPVANINANSITDLIDVKDYEAELLLERGLRYRITGDTVVDGVRQLEVEVVV